MTTSGLAFRDASAIINPFRAASLVNRRDGGAVKRDRCVIRVISYISRVALPACLGLFLLTLSLHAQDSSTHSQDSPKDSPKEVTKDAPPQPVSKVGDVTRDTPPVRVQ